MMTMDKRLLLFNYKVSRVLDITLSYLIIILIKLLFPKKYMTFFFNQGL